MASEEEIGACESLERLKESYPELSSAAKILSKYPIAQGGEDLFVREYADKLEGGAREARQIYRTAFNIQEKAALIWANVRDTVSPYYNQTIFNNLPEEFLAHLQSLPEYDRLFGSLDYVSCDHCRSIFGPAAYFADLMRFADTYISRRNQRDAARGMGIPADCTLEYRRPDLYKMRLDCGNSSDLMPQIDLVNELLEAFITTEYDQDAYLAACDAIFPQSLPFNRPLEEIRSYLKLYDTSLYQIYNTFAKPFEVHPFDEKDPHLKSIINREFLELSPKDLNLIITEISSPEDISRFYGGVPLTGINGLDNVDVLLDQTGLTRKDLNELLFQDLNRHEINAGLSRLFFINSVDDGLEPLALSQDESDGYDRLLNLSPKKLDRIYRFLKLSCKLGWSFADLDWSLRSLHEPYAPEKVLKFDGINDYVACQNASKLDLPVLGAFTIEAWINPTSSGRNAVVGLLANHGGTNFHTLLEVDPFDKLVFRIGQQGAAMSDFVNTFEIASNSSLPLGVFTHIALVAGNGKARLYINGVIDGEEILATPFVGPDLDSSIRIDMNIGRDLFDEYFNGCIKDVRIWRVARDPMAIEEDRYHRFTGRESDLIGYWPLTEDQWINLLDLTPGGTPGVLGGEEFITQPKWVYRDLILDPLPFRGDGFLFQFNGVDQYMAARGVDIADTKEFSLEAWVKIEAQQDRCIVCLGDDSGKPRLAMRITALGKLAFQAQVGSSPQTYESINSIPLGKLTHFCIVLKEVMEGAEQTSKLEMYINGFLDRSRTISPPITLGLDNGEMNAGRSFNGSYFQGGIKEIRMWSTARTRDQIALYMHRPVPSGDPGLIGYWRLDEAEDGMARDLSYHRNDLHLGGLQADYMPTPVTTEVLPKVFPVLVNGTVLQFDGDNDVIAIKNDKNWGLGRYERMTLELWFKAATSAYPDRNQVIFTQGDIEAGLNIYLKDRTLYVLEWNNSLERDSLSQSVLKAQITNGPWHHVALTHNEFSQEEPENGSIPVEDNMEFRAYLDGVPMRTTSGLDVCEGHRLSPVGTAYLGGLGEKGITRFEDEDSQPNSEHLYFFAGQVADLRIWNSVKSAEEIADGRHRHLAPQITEDLVTYMPMNEGSGGIVFGRPEEPAEKQYKGTLQGREIALVTSSDDPQRINIYSHYFDPEDPVALEWNDYNYSGRMRITDGNAAVGVTILSRHPEGIDQCYILGRDEDNPQFRLFAHPSGVQTLKPATESDTIESTVTPQVNVWYRFLIKVQYGSDKTSIDAKVWPEDSPEQTAISLNAVDESDIHITKGTVGLWSSGSDMGQRQFDNLRVWPTSINDPIPSDLYLNFEDQSQLPEPENWLDTEDRLKPVAAGGLFKQVSVAGGAVGETAFGTDSTDDNIHSYYSPGGSGINPLSWNNYVYQGRMRISDADGGIGVTFLSRQPDGIDQYYALQRDAEQGTFKLFAHPQGVQKIRSSDPVTDRRDSGIRPLPNVWYRFQINIQNGEGSTRIQAKIWAETDIMPAAFQIDAIDDSSICIKSGTVGIWASGSGSKYFDSLRVCSKIYMSESFESYSANQDPLNWRDTKDHYSSIVDDSLFKVFLDGGRKVFGTTSTDDFIHSHYTGSGASSWSNYIYMGRMRLSNVPNPTFSGIGVTFLSQYLPGQTKKHYKLIYNPDDTDDLLKRSFCITSYPQLSPSPLQGTISSNIVPVPNTWYRFRIEVEDAGSRTNIRAKIWPESAAEPSDYQIIAYDASANRLKSGTVGVVTLDIGTKYFDDLEVVGEILLSPSSVPVGWIDVGSRVYGEDDGLFGTVDLSDNIPRWMDIEDYPVLLHPISHSALMFDGQKQYLASGACLDLSQFTLEAWISLSEIEESPILSLIGNLNSSTATVVFGTDNLGHLRLWQSPEIQLALSSGDPLAIDELVHVAVRVKANGTPGDRVTFSVVRNGNVVSASVPSTNLPGSFLLETLRGEIGRDGSNQYFHGRIKEVRIWNRALETNEIALQVYQRPVGSSGLVGYWSLGEDSEDIVEDLSPSGNSMRLGGLEEDRRPVLTDLDAPYNGFWRPERKVLDFNGISHTILLTNEGQGVIRRRRTVEVWFRVEDKWISGRKQVIYQEGGDKYGLGIYIHDGSLYFGGYNINESQWEGTWLHTDRIESGRWHHCALVLDGRAEIRDESFQGFLDGKRVDAGPGSQIWGQRNTFAMGGIRTVIRFHDGISEAASGHNFRGQILCLRIWNSARSADEIQSNLYVNPDDTMGSTLRIEPDLVHWEFDSVTETWIPDISERITYISKVPLSQEGSLVLWWEFDGITDLTIRDLSQNGHTATFAQGQLQTIVLSPVYRLPELSLDTAALDGIAAIKRLKEAYELPLDRLTALWYSINHVGKDGHTPLFDSIFNPKGTVIEPWDYYLDDPVRWDKTGAEDRKRDGQIRSRLMGALRVSHDDLNAIVEHISGSDENIIDLDSAYLWRMYQIANLAGALQLSVKDLIQLLSVFHKDSIDSLQDVTEICNLAEWMKGAGLSVSGLAYLTHDPADLEGISVSLTEADIVSMAGSLMGQSSEILINSMSFVSDLISQAQSADILTQLQILGLIKGYVFSWGKIPGNDEGRLIEFLTNKFGIDWVKTAKIEKIDNGRTIKVSDEDNSLSLKLNDEDTKVILEIDDLRRDEFIAKMENDELNIYVNGIGAVTPVYTDDYDLEGLLSTLADPDHGNWIHEFDTLAAEFDQIRTGLGSDIILRLQSHGFIDANGLVLPGGYGKDSLMIIFDGQTPDASTVNKLSRVTEVLELRKALQDQIVSADGPVHTALRKSRDGLRRAVISELASLFGVQADMISAIFDYLDDNGEPDASLFMEKMKNLSESGSGLPEALRVYLSKMSKLVYMAGSFELTDAEMGALLSYPDRFSFSNILQPTLRDLDNLYLFKHLQSAFEDTEGKLIDLLALEDAGAIENALGDLAGWEPRQVRSLVEHFGATESRYNTIPGLNHLNDCFDLAGSMQAGADLLLQLADTTSLGTADEHSFYSRQSSGLLEVLRAGYTDEEWPGVYQPIYGKLAEKRRDALLDLALERLPEYWMEYLFCLDGIPDGNSSLGNEELRIFLGRQLKLDWAEGGEEGASISRTDGTIRVIWGDKWAEIALGDTKAALSTDNGLALDLTINPELLFSWSDIPESSTRMKSSSELKALVNFLEKGLGLDWMDDAYIVKKSENEVGITNEASVTDTDPREVTITLSSAPDANDGTATLVATLVSEDTYTYYLRAKKESNVWKIYLRDIYRQNKFRRGPNIFQEYFLMDMEVGHEVETSRIVQGTAAVQYYIQRCLMNLEPGVDPSTIPQVEWEWVKNYRVWEANRKVFLYPENYIEPELRDTKTPLFKDLEQELLQTDISQESVETAYIHYLDKFSEVANLKIVGSYLHTDLESYDPSNPDAHLKKVLYLVGKTATEPKMFYLREWISDEMGERWLPWEKIDLVINSDFVTPVYAFGKLFLFWTEFTKLKEGTDDGKTKDVFNTTVKYSYYNLSKEWKQPQSYVELDNKLGETEHNQLRWQRLNAQRLLNLSSLEGDNGSQTRDEENAQVLQIDELTHLAKDVSSFDMSSMTWEFWVRIINNHPEGWQRLNTTLPAGHTEAESYERTSTLADYGNGSFKVKAIHKVTEIPEYAKKTRAATYVATRTVSGLNYFTNNDPDGASAHYSALRSAMDSDPNVNVGFKNQDQIRSLISNGQNGVIELVVNWRNKKIAAANAYSAYLAAYNYYYSIVNDPNYTPEQKENARLAMLAAEGAYNYAVGQRDAALAAARAEAETANQEATTAMNDELKKPRWESKKAFLSFEVAGQSSMFLNTDDNPDNDISVDYGSWQHVAVTLNMVQGQGYAFSFYFHDLQGNRTKTQSITTLGSSLLAAGGELTLGIQDAAVRDAFTAQMSEFRLWDRVRSDAEIQTGLNQRLNGSTGLFCLPLNVVETNSVMTLVPSLNPDPSKPADLLNFSLPALNELLKRTMERERLMLFYGDQIVSLRSNMKDKSFSLKLDPVWYKVINDVDLSYEVTKDGTFKKAVLRLVETTGLRINDFAKGSVTAENGVITLSTTTTTTTTSDDQKYILRNLEGKECSFADVNNQPGWYILDTGDDEFLVKMVIRVGDNENPKRIPTTEEMMRLDYSLSAGESPSQEVTLSFDPNKPYETAVGKSNPLIVPSSSIEEFNIGAGGRLALNLVKDPQGERAIVASRNGGVDIWDLNSRIKTTIECRNYWYPSAMTITDDGTTAVSASSWFWYTVLTFWDLTRSAGPKSLISWDYFGDSIQLAAVSDDGKVAVTASTHGALQVWYSEKANDMSTNPKTLNDTPCQFRALKVFREGDHLRALTTSTDGVLRLWDLDNGTLLKTIGGHSSGSTDVVDIGIFDGKIIAVTVENGRTIRVWDLNAGAILGDLSGHTDNIVAVRILGSRVISASSDRTLKVWDLEGLNPPKTFVNDGEINAMDAVGGSDGNRAVTFSNNGTLKVWDLDADPLEEDNRHIKFEFMRLNTYAIQELSENLFAGGIDSLLSLESQKSREMDFWDEYSPSETYVSRSDNNIPSAIDFKGAQRLYFEEIFFHVPFLIANNLNSNQKFEEAQRWYHYIFNPTANDEGGAQGRDKDRYWRYLPFRDDSFQSLKTLLTDEEALAAYREDPFDPHAIAALRLTAYKKAVVMKYIDNLLDWGDSLFMQDTRESINEALGLYVMAYDLLGPRPNVKTIKRFQDIGAYEDFIEDYQEDSEFLTAVEKIVPSNGGAAILSPHSNIITDFCVPENEKFIGYWDLVEDRLYKVRHSLNFEGTFRQLDLFAPPIEPMELVRSVAMGSGISGALADLNVAVPHYRYPFVIALAKEMTSNVISLGSSLLDALEKRDAEQLSNLQNTQEKQILGMMTDNKVREIEEAKKEKDALEESQSSILDKKNYYEGLYNENWSGHEIGAYVLSNLSLLGYPVDIAFRVAKAVLALTEMEVEVGFSGIGPHNVIKKKVIGPDTAEAIGEATEAGTELLQQIAELIEKAGERIRRRAEWGFERDQAQSEYDEIGIQIEIAQSQIDKSQRELEIHNKMIQHNQEIAYFYRRKFSNEALYNWMVGRLSSLYFQAYKIAYDMAKSAEKSLQYELASTDTYITSTHWDGLRKGLLAGESLMLQIDQMEKSHLAQDGCLLQIEKTISMQRTFPGALLLLMAKGACEFQLKEEIFDRDYPGHYFRVIKTIELTVVTSGIDQELEPYLPVNISLIQLGNKTLIKPNKDAVLFLLGQNNAVQPGSGILRVNWRANQQVAVSKVNDRDGGMFALDFIFDNKYFPFEGTGAISSWRLEIPKASNPDLVIGSGSTSTLDIQDILIHVRYTAKSDRGSFKKEVETMLGMR